LVKESGCESKRNPDHELNLINSKNNLNDTNINILLFKLKNYKHNNSIFFSHKSKFNFTQVFFE